MAKKKKSREKSIGLKPLSSTVIVWVLAGRYYGDPVRRAGARQIHDAVVYVVGEGYFPGRIGGEGERVCLSRVAHCWSRFAGDAGPGLMEGCMIFPYSRQGD